MRDKHGRNRQQAKANSTSWKPGESGNPKGRPKGKSMSDAVRAYLDEQHTKSSKRTRRTAVIAALFHTAVGRSSASVSAAKFLLETDRDIEYEERLSAIEKQLEELKQ